MAAGRTSLLGKNTRRQNRPLPHQIAFVSELARSASGYARQHHCRLSPDQQELQSLLLRVRSMIGDAVQLSLRSPQVVISVTELFSNAAGSRMPEVLPDLLTVEISRSVVAACLTTALQLDEAAGRTRLILDRK